MIPSHAPSLSVTIHVREIPTDDKHGRRTASPPAAADARLFVLEAKRERARTAHSEIRDQRHAIETGRTQIQQARDPLAAQEAARPLAQRRARRCAAVCTLAAITTLSAGLPVGFMRHSLPIVASSFLGSITLGCTALIALGRSLCMDVTLHARGERLDHEAAQLDRQDTALRFPVAQAVTALVRDEKAYSEGLRPVIVQAVAQVTLMPHVLANLVADYVGDNEYPPQPQPQPQG